MNDDIERRLEAWGSASAPDPDPDFSARLEADLRSQAYFGSGCQAPDPSPRRQVFRPAVLVFSSICYWSAHWCFSAIRPPPRSSCRPRVALRLPFPTTPSSRAPLAWPCPMAHRSPWTPLDRPWSTASSSAVAPGPKSPMGNSKSCSPGQRRFRSHNPRTAQRRVRPSGPQLRPSPRQPRRRCPIPSRNPPRSPLPLPRHRPNPNARWHPSPPRPPRLTAIDQPERRRLGP